MSDGGPRYVFDPPTVFKEPRKSQVAFLLYWRTWAAMSVIVAGTVTGIAAPLPEGSERVLAMWIAVTTWIVANKISSE